MGNGSSRKLSPKTIKELQEHINVDFTTEEIQDWYKDYYVQHLQKGESGLTRIDFIQVYNNLFEGDASEFAEQVFRTFDTDGNNIVDFKEFILGLCISGSTDPNMKLKWAFNMYDLDQNGFITHAEMNHIIRAICKMTNCNTLPTEFETPEDMTMKIFKILDKNSDNQISLEEFVDGAEKVQIIIDILQCDPSPE